MAGLTVLMIRKKDQVIYKLPDNMSVQSLSQDQRERLLAEINLLHHQQTTAQALAATQAQTQQVQMAQAQALAASQGVRAIAPSGQGQNGVSSLPSQAGSRLSTPSTPTSGNNMDSQQKTTRRYNKTGKYSKKKLMQQQMLDRQTDIQGGRSGLATPGEPYPRLQDRMKSQQQQPLVFNNTNPQVYQTIAAASSSLNSGATSIQSSFLQQHLHHQQMSGLASVDHKKQLKLLQEIHELQKQIEVQQSNTETFREHERTIKRILAHNQSVDAKTQQSARYNIVEAEKTLERLKGQLKEKENTFREQYPVASQQLLLLQQQQIQAAASAAAGRQGTGSGQNAGTISTGTSALSKQAVGLSSGSLSGMQRTIADPLQQKIAEHHLAVRNAMAAELEANYKALKRPDWWTPFKSLQDAMERLVPFHVYQYPAEDLEVHATAFGKRSEAEMNARALAIHRRKQELFTRYNDTLKKSAVKATNPSSTLDIVALRYCLEDEQSEYKKITEAHERIAIETKVLREELERRQLQLIQQRRAEAALIEAQQKLMLERQRQEELGLQQDEARQRQGQQAQQRQRLEEAQEMQQHLQQQQQQQDQSQQVLHHQQRQLQQPSAEEEEVKKKEDERKELERKHQQELEKQLRIKQEQRQKEEEAARAASQAASRAQVPGASTAP
ncbi:hypothetical protein BGX28_003532 [Mortierella sp. GBA30]|nr:hypothetical protein BGX28_003532 [Mortierella sp. GBA30]